MANTKGCKKKENVLNYKWYIMFCTRTSGGRYG